MIRIVESTAAAGLLRRRGHALSAAEEIVRPILEDVRKRGDKALLEYARQFDRLDAQERRASRRANWTPRPEASVAAVPRAVETAAANVRAFARLQLPRRERRELAPGLRLAQIVRPLDTVGRLHSLGPLSPALHLMMTVVPAQVAGVPNICVASPRAGDEVFGTAALLGVAQVFQMGGAQAIAAFAYGTKTVPRADRIVGPGNIYVAAAKKLLAGEVGIDFVAGPTEILIIAVRRRSRLARGRPAGPGRARHRRLGDPADALKVAGRGGRGGDRNAVGDSAHGAHGPRGHRPQQRHHHRRLR